MSWVLDRLMQEALEKENPQLPAWQSMRESGASYLRQWSFVWRRLSHSLMPPRDTCSNFCLTADVDWTEWKNFSTWGYECDPQQLVVQQLAAMWLKMPGMPPPSRHEMLRRATNTPLLKNVQRLRTSTYLICDEQKERLTATPVSAMWRWNNSVYFYAGSKMSGKTFTHSSRPGNLNSPWTDEQHDPLRDVIEWDKRTREEHWK